MREYASNSLKELRNTTKVLNQDRILKEDRYPLALLGVKV
jgi:hypothetical protein